MKKIISLVILCSLLVILVATMVASAQGDSPNECCTIYRRIDFKDSNECKAGDVSAPDGFASADCNDGVAMHDSSSDLCGGESWGMYCLVNTVNSVTDWIFYLMMVLVVAMIVIGGAIYMLAAGNPERAGRGKGVIIYGIVGLVIALLARLIPSVVKLIVGMG